MPRIDIFASNFSPLTFENPEMLMTEIPKTLRLDPSVRDLIDRRIVAGPKYVPSPEAMVAYPGNNYVGGFFEVTGAVTELYKIRHGIESNDGRLTAGSSMDLDLWHEMQSEWIAMRDRRAFDAGRASSPALSENELTACAWAIDHLMAKHSHSTVNGPGGRVPLKPLLDKLLGEAAQ